LIDSVINLILRCPHHHLTRPFTPLGKSGLSESETYIVCVDCAKQFTYDLHEMRLGNAIERAKDRRALSGAGTPPLKALTYAMMAVLPFAILIGAAFRIRGVDGRKHL
jgi:hypothetical protein